MNTAECTLNKLHQGNCYFVTYFVEFQYIIAKLNWNNAAKHPALNHGLSEELKDILSTQDLPKDQNSYIALMKWHDMQFHTHKAEYH